MHMVAVPSSLSTGGVTQEDGRGCEWRIGGGPRVRSELIRASVGDHKLPVRSQALGRSSCLPSIQPDPLRPSSTLTPTLVQTHQNALDTKMNLLVCMICYADHEDVLFVQCEGEVSTVPSPAFITPEQNTTLSTHPTRLV